VVRALGLIANGNNTDNVKRRCDELGIETQHIVRGSISRTGVTDDQLRAAVAASRSYAQTIRTVGLVAAGGNYVQIKRRIAKLGIDASHFTGQGWNKGGGPVTVPKALDEVLVKDRWTQSHKLKKRLFRAGLKHERCELCGWAVRAPDGRIPLELDHMNGDKNDNRLENLRILCPNCHALQPTHRGLNKASRRR
jgi:hypothetical protein